MGKGKIIEINHVLTRIIRKIIIIDHETLVFLIIVFMATGSLIGLGVCTLGRGDRQSGSAEELQGLIQELETELSMARNDLEAKDSEIEALNSSLDFVKGSGAARITSVRWHIANDNVHVTVKFETMGAALNTIGVKRVEPESSWFVQDLVDYIDHTETWLVYYWKEDLAGAPEGFLAPDTRYRIAVTFTGGYDEILVTSSENEEWFSEGDGIEVARDG